MEMMSMDSLSYAFIQQPRQQPLEQPHQQPHQQLLAESAM
jgi:hypothetical protein